MVERYAAELKLDVIVVLNVLRNLRNHAVTKLASNQKFKTTGVATLKVKIVNPQQKSVSYVLADGCFYVYVKAWIASSVLLVLLFFSHQEKSSNRSKLISMKMVRSYAN